MYSTHVYIYIYIFAIKHWEKAQRTFFIEEARVLHAHALTRERPRFLLPDSKLVFLLPPPPFPFFPPIRAASTHSKLPFCV